MDPTLRLIGGPDVDFPTPAPLALSSIPRLSPIYTTTTDHTQLNKLCDPKLASDVDAALGQIVAKPGVNPHEDNPFERIGRLKFMNRAAVKLANIDAIFDVTNYRYQFLENGVLSVPAIGDDGSGVIVDDTNQTKNVFTFADIAAAPGAFTQYIMDRRPGALGYGISLKVETESLNWNKDLIQKTEGRFDVQYGEDGTGNLYTQSGFFIDYVLSKQPDGVNLVTGDGGFDLEDMPQLKEMYSTRLILCQIAIALGILAERGNMVLKIFNSLTSVSAQLIALLTLVFNDVYIFKPISSRPINSERYIVCKNMLNTSLASEISDALLDVNDDHPDFTPTRPYLESLFSDKLSADYLNWLRDLNNGFLQSRLDSAHVVLTKLSGKYIEIPRYDLHKAVISWGLYDRKRPHFPEIDYPYAWKCYPSRAQLITQIKAGDLTHLDVLPDLYFEELRVRILVKGVSLMDWWFTTGQRSVNILLSRSKQRPTLLRVRAKIDELAKGYPRLIPSKKIAIPNSKAIGLVDKFGCGFICLVANNYGGTIDIIENRPEYIEIYSQLIAEFGDPTKHRVVVASDHPVINI